jgi:hypothetical protein
MPLNRELLRRSVGSATGALDLPGATLPVPLPGVLPVPLPGVLPAPGPIPLPGPLPPPGTVTIVTGPGLIGFKLNGVLVWVIDEKLFGGTPVLTHVAQGTKLKVELKGALYPGTKLSADFILLLGPKGLSGTPMDMAMTLGGFHGQSLFELWLARLARLMSPVQLNETACPLGPGSLELQGSGSALFTPNWETQCTGTGVASIKGLTGSAQDSDTLAIRLLKPGDPSFRATPKNKRTLLTLQRGTHSWDLQVAPLGLAIGTLTPQPELFDRIDVEAGENSAADQDHTLVAQSFAVDKLSFAPGGGLTGADGNSLSIALAFPRFATDFESNETFLVAHFPQSPVWIRVEGFAFQAGDVPGGTAFEVDATGGAVTAISCAPALLAAAAPLPGDLAARPLALSGSARLIFASQPGASPGWGVLASVDVAAQPKVSLPEFAVGLLRRDDLLSLEFVFENLAVEGGGGISPRLVRIDKNKDAFVKVRFNAPQNIGEQAFVETSLPPPVTAPPVLALAAGPSTLVFKLGAGVVSLDYTVANLLDWKQFDLSVSKAASLPDPPPAPPPQDAPAPAPPKDTETAIEAPWHLFISPNSTGGFAHQIDAVTHHRHTELWHTRLGIKKIVGGVPSVDEQDSSTRKIRAIWTPGFSEPPRPLGDVSPFLMSLRNHFRDQIVALSSDFTIPQTPPVAINVDRLMLSALGAWLDSDGLWNPATAEFDLLEWRHRAAMGRDNYVKIVFKGFLVPFGHRAVVTIITERKFIENPAGHTTAYLIQRQFIVVREPVKDYGYLKVFATGGGRNFPYTQVRITTLVTPNLDFIGDHFFPTVGGNPFLFHVIGTDRDGQTSEFTSPMVFVVEAQQISGMADYTAAPLERRKRDMGGQQVAFAQASSVPGNAALHAATMTFTVLPLAAGVVVPNQPLFFPALDHDNAAEVSIPALQQINGTTSTVDVKFYDDYVNNDFKKGGVFLQLVNPLGVTFGGDKTGGVATPDLSVGGLSRDFGTVSGTAAALDKFATGTFDPTQYFGGIASAKLLGFIPLTDIIQLILDVTGAPEKVPKILTNRLPDRIVTNLAWKPDVKDWSIGFATVHFTDPDDPVHPEHLELDVTITTLLPPPPGAAPDANVEGHMRSFDLTLFNVIGLHFKSVDFKAPVGKKLDMSADLGKIEFQGDLSFLNTLQQFIPSNGFSDPPDIEVTAQGVTVGYTLAIPSVGVGVFSVENISLGAALELSFIGDPIRFRFHFSERQHPFLVTVSLLGGGGFFGLELGPDGVELLEASIEFGANVSIDLVVASANVHIMAGVYLKLDFATKASQLTGYLRAGGSANVLGLITVSVEFYLGFTYYFPIAGPPAVPCKIAGEASVTVEVDVLFFSASVSLSFRREFSDPTISFADVIGPADWDEYCDAFAA